MSNEIDDDDLYGDIKQTIESSDDEGYKEKFKDLQLEIQQLTDRINKNELELKVSNENNLALKKDKEQLQKINEILMKNISCLFKTAQLEIQRKDKEIDNLRDQIESFRNNNNINRK
ncbi:hypothetical protein DLAC_02561 [Tieghemostelium lacteum]|uniref:Uncharacterized protein n=1 Tax=Tieghemostelium lacteum TaxID=361077 RepID=A0A152A365_TIELA|nr:hypothetical protein DLAC_02561 [Tieghemostelium lacteum]|eukprot:KYR00547.1 hypothetical protein DLAC_02561 [Tieghemostelium lacteum]